MTGSDGIPSPSNVDGSQILLFMGTCEESTAYLCLKEVLFKYYKM